MFLARHGGACCGIRHIFNFGTGDTVNKMLPAITPETLKSMQQNSSLIFRKEAPEETYLQRLERLIAHKDANWPYGVIEVVLTDYAVYGDENDVGRAYYDQVRYWRKPLEKLGFKLVTKCFNSNSHNYDYIFHRCVEPPKKKTVKKSSVSLRNA